MGQLIKQKLRIRNSWYNRIRIPLFNQKINAYL